MTVFFGKSIKAAKLILAVKDLKSISVLFFMPLISDKISYPHRKIPLRHWLELYQRDFVQKIFRGILL